MSALAGMLLQSRGTEFELRLTSAQSTFPRVHGAPLPSGHEVLACLDVAGTRADNQFSGRAGRFNEFTFPGFVES